MRLAVPAGVAVLAGVEGMVARIGFAGAGSGGGGGLDSVVIGVAAGRAEWAGRYSRVRLFVFCGMRAPGEES